nr:sulfur oxidation c-type cytochrome SoxA [Chenggangzhangella methanolivorans]
MSASTQAMQRDDVQNPGMLAAGQGEALWNAQPPGGGQSCASCHGDATASMKGVAARYPAFDEATRRPIDLQDRIRACNARRPGAPDMPHESEELVALSAYVGLQSRGTPTAPDPDPRLAPFRARGQALFERPIGQLNLSCAACHDARAGGRLAGALIPQGHPNGYPLYRLEWQGMGSLQRRLRNCMTGVRAEAPPFGAPDFVELELYLQSRAAPLAVETPAVRP